MLENILKPGDKVEIKRIMNHETASSEKYYLSQLLDLIDDNRANIAMPIEGGKIIPLEIGDRYQLFFYTHNGLYQSKCIIMERFRNNNLYVAVIKFIADLEKFQRRQFFRLECIMEVSVREINEQESHENEPVKQHEQPIWYKGLATDISGGGLRFNCETKLEKDSLIEIILKLPIGGVDIEIITKAHIVFCKPIFNRPGHYENRIEYVNMSLKDREKIIRYIFDEDRKRRKRLSITD